MSPDRNAALASRLSYSTPWGTVAFIDQPPTIKKLDRLRQYVESACVELADELIYAINSIDPDAREAGHRMCYTVRTLERLASGESGLLEGEA